MYHIDCCSQGKEQIYSIKKSFGNKVLIHDKLLRGNESVECKGPNFFLEKIHELGKRL